jgi:hypothetical protein
MLVVGRAWRPDLLIDVQTVCCAPPQTRPPRRPMFSGATPGRCPTRAFGHSKVHRYGLPAMLGIQVHLTETGISGTDR